MPGMVEKRRTHLDQGCNGVRCAWTSDWGDRLSNYSDRVKKQATGKKRRRGDQQACAPRRDALRRESGLSAGLFLCESTGAIREFREGSATRRALLSRSQ